MQKAQQGILDSTKYTIQSKLLFYKDRLYVGTHPQLKSEFFHLLHNSPQGGHSGYYKTLHIAHREFYWPKMKGDIKTFIKECDICQQQKLETIHPARLLQPLPIPSQV